MRQNARRPAATLLTRVFACVCVRVPTTTQHRYEGLKKSELELVIDEHLSENASQFAGDPRFAPFFTSRTRAAGSPVKKEAPELRVARRRTTKPAEEAAPAE